ncbi:MAG TPA: GNAT family N-acetyltransferase [Paracoccaceae bacterium]|nr:GNAT family N-acetyltransferase [Paracoccaceae bacterium]
MAVEITTERLRLRPLEMADAPRIHEFCSEFAVARWLARVPHPYPEGDAERFIGLCLKQGACTWAIERRVQPGLIGIIGLDDPAEQQHLGYWLGQPYWGQGHASEAGRAVVDWAFGVAGAGGLVSGAFEGNGASLRVQEKLGFALTGRRMAPCLSLGADRPHIDTALPRAAWEARA